MSDDIELIAGHRFPRTRDAVCQSNASNGEPCLRTWDEIRDCTEADVDAEGVAHIGRLTISEAKSIMDRRAREDAAWMAVVGVAAK